MAFLRYFTTIFLEIQRKVILSIKILGVFFVISLSVVALLHRKPAFPKTSCESCDVQGSGKRDAA
jgi:hypothetical protein